MDLVTPHTRHQASYLAGVDEFAGAHRDGDGQWVWIDDAGGQHDYTRAELESPAGFAHFVERRTDPDRPVAPGFVPCTFLWMEADGAYVGSLAIRHELNDFLRHEGGHIGYSVRPSARRRGHATEALRQSLTIARDRLGLDRVLVTCDDDNLGSITVIEANGGELENVVTSSDGVPVRRYWITGGGR